jgi:hypothetical protein
LDDGGSRCRLGDLAVILKIKRVNALNFQEFSGFLIFSGIFMYFWELSGDLRIFSEFLGVFRIF